MSAAYDYDVAIIGGGPAGLSAALVLGRCRRRVIVIDHGRPRNRTAQTVNGYLALIEASPEALRQTGRKQVAALGVDLLDGEVIGAWLCDGRRSHFEVSVVGRPLLKTRKLLLATGVLDKLPPIENIEALYGKSVHHCPYCDGWEHRDERLVALGEGPSVVGLALSLRNWSQHVTACSNGRVLSRTDCEPLERNGVAYRHELPTRLAIRDGRLSEIIFSGGPPLACDALFFSSKQCQRSNLPTILGCKCDEVGLIQTNDKEGTGIDGLFLAGDADGDVQFAIVAAAEGAIAATAINRELQDEDFGPA